ncbi:remodeling and spacing factor 1 [Rhopalosiphum maidis]|uniref:remodeling and spacing factor 1 n=1 Tax=Rhopalosiphum maidis TaxID=43146 RepID=UPI000EFF8710|nr:remodeling and spacing factor 1 [Rhopalosiphum maidis]
MTASPVAEAQDVCASDPNFAVIFAFCERFGDSCGVTIPTFQELQEMLENTTEVPDALVDLHIKLLRRVKKSVNADKWERAVLKFCQEYSIPEFWELENYGYKGISVKLKLRILKTLFEAQFDSNVKFKSEINKLESSTLHSQPLGWDRSGVAYWVQFDRACNLRVYREDIDEDTWEIVAKDRSTLVNLINELSGAKDNTLDDIEDSNSIETGSEGENELPSSLNPEKPSLIIENNKKEYSTTESTNVELEKNELDSQENPLDKPINFKRKLNEDDDLPNKCNIPIVGEEIEESVMIVKGEGSGQECDTGNPDETNTQNDTSKIEDVKKPKLWSIEAICSSSKEVKEEIVSVPKTGFFFGDDSVPCFNNVSNGEDSCIDDSKLKVAQSNKDIEESKKNKISVEELNKNMKTDEELCTNKKNDEEINKSEKLDEVDTTTSHGIKSLNLNEFSCKNVSKQSVFNIKVHEEEVQITERKANEVFTKSETSIKHNTTSVYGSTSFDSYIKPQESQINSMTEIVAHNKDNQPQISSKINTYDADHKTECNKIEVDQTNDLLPDLTNSDIFTSTKVEEQKNQSVKFEENTKCNIDQHLEENKKKEIDQQLIVSEPIKTNTLDNKIQLNEQLTTSKSSQSDEEKILDNRCETIKANESFANTIGQYDDINDQPSSYVVEQKACILDTSVSNLADQSTISDDQILENKSIIDDEKPNDNLVEENEPDKQVSEHIEHTQITDDLETSSTYSNSDLNKHTESDNSIINSIASSSKAHDQTLADNVDQCPQISKQVDNNQNTNKSKKTLHNISNIIDTNMTVVSDSVKANEQPINYINTEIKQLDHLTKEKNVFQEKKPFVVNIDSPNNFNSKHSLNNILQKSDNVKEMLECPNTESSNVDSEIDKIDSVKSEVKIKELHLKSKDVLKDLTVLKEDKMIENEKNISPIISSVPENQKEEVLDVLTKETKSDKDYELSTMSTEQYKTDEIKRGDLNVNCDETIQNKDLKEKQKLFKIVNDTDTYVYNKEKLNLEDLKKVSCNKDDNLVHDLSVQNSTLKTESLMEFKEESAVDNSLSDKNVINKSIKNDKNLENKEKETNFDKDVINQNLKIEIDSEDDEENIIKSSDEQLVISPVQESTCENSDETNQETFNKSPKEEFDYSIAVDQTFEEDNKSDEEEVAEEIPKKKGRPGRKKGKRGRAKKVTTVKQENSSITEEKVKRPYKPRQKKVVTISEEVTVFPEPAGDDNVRRSRRIAEIKIKEQFIPATQYDDIDIPLKSPKKKDKGGKKGSTSSKKLENAEESDDEDEEDPISKKFKKKRRKGKSDSLKKINMVNPWNVDSESSSSENNIELFEDYDHEEEEEIPRPGIEPNISDHEFSPESDINDEDEEYLPEKRARTAHKKDEGEPLKDDMCQKCNKSDQPEWILLCDTCNQGWHASCLRPPLMVIPDGDWYCPPCRHQALLNALKETLKKYDGESKKRENEELRRKRLAYVGISLQNVISSKTEEVKSDKSPVVHQSSEDDEEESESEDYDSEPLYTLRARRQANVSYRFNDYDDMINEAILEETGVDESAAKKSAELKTDKNDNDENNDSDNDENDKDREDSPIAPALLHLRGRKKSKKLTNLDISSDDGSDEDFKGPSDGDDDYEEDLSEYSDDSVKRRPQPTRRSVRNRKNVVDPDFINDDSSEESDQRSKKKRSRPWSDSSNSEEEDLTWGKRKKKRTNAYSSSSLSSKPAAKGSKRKRSENNGARKFKKSTIKFGMNSDSDFDGQPKRRTRGRQITYAESDDSEEEVQTKKRKVASDEEDEYVLNDEELEVENEDHTLEVEEDDAVASNEEEKDDDDVGEDEAVDEEEEDEDEEEEVDTKPAIASSGPAPSNVVHPTVAKPPPPPAVVQSVIREPASSLSSDLPVAEPHHNPHPRLLPPAVVQRLDKQEPPSAVDPAHGSPDKRKRPQHQPKKCPSPNPLVDYGGGAGYPYAPDATKVTVSTVVPPSPAFVRPPVTVPGAAGVFKTMVPRTAGDVGFSAVPVPYRTAVNKMTGPAAYLPPPQPQVQQIYQAPTSTPPPPQPQPSSTSYSPYPIDYAAAGASLPPPPPLIPFRNVVVAPPPLHEHALLPGAAHQQPPPQQSAATGGDSEFGGLVSYFSSQQEDDFDT